MVTEDELVTVTFDWSATITRMTSPAGDSVDRTAKADPHETVGGICSTSCWQLPDNEAGSVGTSAQRLPLNTPTAWLELICVNQKFSWNLFARSVELTVIYSGDTGQSGHGTLSFNSKELQSTARRIKNA